MGDYFLRLKKCLKGLVSDKKKNTLLILILVIATGLFFSILFGENVFAQKKIFHVKADLAFLDPMKKIDKSSFEIEEEEKAPQTYINNQKAKEDFLKTIKQKKYESLVKGHPIEKMIPAISQKEKAVAAFLIGIAKKESNWGKFSPKKNGRDCYNYWGYRGSYNRTASGYSCFDSPEQAVDEVGRRIEKLMSQRINTPERMIVWKCGSSCAGHDPYSVKKWISDVKLYYNKANS